MIFLSLLFSVAQAFTLLSSTDPDMEGWANPEVTFYLNNSNCPASVNVESVISDAMNMWNGIPTSRIKVSFGGYTTQTGYTDPPTIICDTTFSVGDPNGSPAVGGGTFSGHRINAGRLTLNASSGQANIAAFNPTILKVILAHEIGHVLGLGHSPEASALMYFSVGVKDNLTLAQDDIDGMTYLYPRDEWGQDKPLGCASVGSLPRPPSPWTFLFILMPFFLALFLRRSSRIKSDGAFFL